MMSLKKLVCLSAAIAAAMVSWAVEVTPEQASTAVRNWIRANPSPMAERFSADTGVAKTYSKNGKALFHVVQLDNEGFVVTSGDTRQTPIVAFSTTGRYEDDLQNPLCAILQADQANIRDVFDRCDARDAANPQSSQGDETFAAAEAEWGRLLSDATSSANLADGASQSSISDVRVDKLIQTRWGQSRWGSKSSCPNTFNLNTPYNYVCGCVATAGAQIMKFWERPTEYLSSFGKSCEIRDSYGNVTTLTKYTIAGSFSWGNMPLSYDSTPNITDTQRSAIGMLTYNVGVAVGMEWGPSGSGQYEYGSSANTGDLTTALRQRFNYNSGTFIWYYLGVGGTTGLSDFKNALYASLDAGMPVSMSIGGGDGGHSIIADGYGYSSGTLYTHLNMGWSGSDDVWYNLVNESIYCSQQGCNFTQLKGIGFNIHPTVAGDVVSGRVLNSSGSTVSGATVKLYSSSGSQVASTTSNVKGIYSFRISTAGSYYVQAEKGSSQSGQTAVNVSSLSSGGSYSSGARTGNIWGVNLTLDGSGPTPTLQSALDTSLTFTTGGDASWRGQTAQTHDGVDAAQSGAISDSQSGSSQTSWMQTTVSGPGTISFWWYVSCEGTSTSTDWDYLAVYVDDVEKARICGTNNVWTQKSYSLSSGSHRIKWVYRKDSSRSWGLDAGFVDQVRWTGDDDRVCTVWFCAGAHGKRTGGGDMKQTVPYGGYATQPTFQGYGGWRFKGLDKPLGPITDNTAITAQYEGGRCGVTFDPGSRGQLVKGCGGDAKQTILFGGKVTNPPCVMPNSGYAFLGWGGGNPELITRSVTLTAQYAAFGYAGGNCGVTFNAGAKGRHVGGGNMKQTIPFSGRVTNPPGIKAYTGNKFIGWDGNLSLITRGVTMTAQYDVGAYTATFVIDTSKGRHVGGGNMKQTVAYKNSPAPPGVRPISANYRFVGWSPAISGMTKNQTYTAVFEAQ